MRPQNECKKWKLLFKNLHALHSIPWRNSPKKWHSYHVLLQIPFLNSLRHRVDISDKNDESEFFSHFILTTVEGRVETSLRKKSFYVLIKKWYTQEKCENSPLIKSMKRILCVEFPWESKSVKIFVIKFSIMNSKMLFISQIIIWYLLYTRWEF